MKTLDQILHKVLIKEIIGSYIIQVSDISIHSNKIHLNSLFVAIKGENSDGHQYIEQAIKNNCVVIVCENKPNNLHKNITYVVVEDTKETLSVIAGNFYDNPSAKLKLIGVTGTNGKTSIVNFLHSLYTNLGYRCGLIGTIYNKIKDESIPSTHTTPDSISLNKLLNKMVESNCQYCFMEVSSHAIVQNRILSLDFDIAIFTNISHDHLDYHKSFEHYMRAKKTFFDNLKPSAVAIINKDDKNAQFMVQNTKASISTIGIKSIADFYAKVIENTLIGQFIRIDNKELWIQLSGIFNVYNILCVYAVATILGEDKDDILRQISLLKPVSGRFQYIFSNQNNKTGIVDYAHAPDALKNVLNTIRKTMNKGVNIITVIGCGGNRDVLKRPIMADIATRLSDKVIITSDNPRDEDPNNIIREMEKGVLLENKFKILRIADRKEAIKTAVMISNKGDVILVAGKGNEKYQEVGREKLPFNDLKILREFLPQN